MTDASTYAKVFRAASQGVLYPYHGSPQENAARQAERLAGGFTGGWTGQCYATADYEHAKQMSGAFSAIADVFDGIAKSESSGL